MKVLVGCEFSGRVRDAFILRGHEAVSCDLLPSTSANGRHIVGNILDILCDGWDLGIFFPPCTYVNAAGLHWNKRRPGRAEKTEEALRFVETLLNANVPRIALENPIGCIGTRIRPPDQIINPYEFGEDASKSTCLWLKNLLPLQPTKFVEPRRVALGNANQPAFEFFAEGAPRWSNQTDSGQNNLAPSADRWAKRSLTYQGIADAMAEQWGKL